MRHIGTIALACGAALAQAQPASLAPEVLFDMVSPSVWVVRTQDEAGRALALGSAVVVGPGRLITNCHVLARAKAVVVARENVTYGATLEFPDPDRDLCQLKVANFHAPAVAIAAPQTWRVGARVYAIGSPRGLETTISDGLLSGIRRNEQDQIEALQITVPISPGSSGGGLFDAQGRLVGITTMILRNAQNVNFAVPASWIAEVPERAQAALAKRAEPVVRTTTAGKQIFEYRWRDRSTGKSEKVIYRLDRTEGNQLFFNDDDRIERVGGGVVRVGKPVGGEFDFAMPPGGWVPGNLEPGARWRLEYGSTQPTELWYSMTLNAQVTESSNFRFQNRDLTVLRIEYTGYTRRRFGAGNADAAYKANAWFAPELGRIVRFDVYARDRYMFVDEILELVDIRPQ
jgi:serine protease Do